MIFLEHILELFRIKKCWEVLEHVIMNSLLLVVNNITVISTLSRKFKNIHESVLRWLILINLIVHMEWYYGENLWFLFIVQNENRDYLISDWIMTMGLTQDWVLELLLKNLMNLGTDIFDLKVSKSDIICSIDCQKNLILKSPRPKSANLRKYFF